MADQTDQPTESTKPPTTDTGSLQTFDHVNRGEAAQMQFPSLAGQPGVEVAERSADLDKATSKRHRKVFRIDTYGYDFDAASFDHVPNFAATRQYMLDHGLRPTGDVSFTGAEPFDDRNVDLVYEVEAVPAQVANPDHIVVPQD